MDMPTITITIPRWFVAFLTIVLLLAGANAIAARWLEYRQLLVIEALKDKNDVLNR